MPVPTLVSNFTGSNENPLSEGGNWATLNSSSNALQRTANAASGGTAAAVCHSYWTPANFGPDLEAYVGITTFNTECGIVFRVQGEGGAGTWDGYQVRVTSTTAFIEIVTNGVATTLISAAQTWANSQWLGVRAEGSTIQLWRSGAAVDGNQTWNRICSVGDSTYTSAGKIGLYQFSTSGRLDNFYAGTDTDRFGPNAPMYYIYA